MSACPEGSYTFVAKTFDNEWLRSQADLSHDLPVPATISFPRAESEVVALADFELFCESAQAAEKFIIALVNEEIGQELLIDVAADRNSFRSPEEWMDPGVEYHLVVGVVNHAGNKAFVEQ